MITDPLKKMYLDMVDLLGVEAQWTTAKDPAVNNQSLKIGFKTAGKDDTEIINAYGAGSVILTCKAVDFSIPPVKFDVFLIGNDFYIARASHEVRVGADIIGYKIIAGGK